MVDHARLLEVLADFARTLVRDYDLGDVLSGLCVDVAELLDVDGAGVMLEDADGDLRFIAASDTRISRIEQLQVDTGEGPCVLAYRHGRAVLIDDLRAAGALAEFAAGATAAGIRAVYSFPMHVDAIRVGAMNLYRTRPGSLDRDAARAAQLLADLATSYILSIDAADRTSRLASQLQHALDSRVVIEQAKGKLSAAWDVDVAKAFDRLRRYARNNQLRLHDVAEDIVTGRLSPDQIPPR